MGKTLWKSPNGKWTIEDETDQLFHKTDWEDDYSTVAMVSASDGWHIVYASIDVKGTMDLVGYVPKTVEAKAFSLLRSMYKAKKQKEQGTNQLPLLYAVIVSPIGTSKGVSVPAPAFYRTYETALKHAESEWKKLSAYQRSNGAFVNVGKLSKSYATAKEIPTRFGYNLVRTVNADYFADKKRRN